MQYKKILFFNNFEMITPLAIFEKVNLAFLLDYMQVDFQSLILILVLETENLIYKFLNV